MAFRREDGTLRVATSQQEAISVAFQFVMGHMCHNPRTGTADRHRLSRLKGEQEHVVPASVQK
eukprot:4325523-Pyramimonas_sp.AAC.1